MRVCRVRVQYGGCVQSRVQGGQYGGSKRNDESDLNSLSLCKYAPGELQYGE